MLEAFYIQFPISLLSNKTRFIFKSTLQNNLFVYCIYACQITLLWIPHINIASISFCTALFIQTSSQKTAQFKNCSVKDCAVPAWTKIKVTYCLSLLDHWIWRTRIQNMNTVPLTICKKWIQIPGLMLGWKLTWDGKLDIYTELC